MLVLSPPQSSGNRPERSPEWQNVSRARGPGSGAFGTTLIAAPGAGGSQVLALPSPTIAPRVVSWWPADGNADDIIDGNPGILKGGATFADGAVSQAFSVDGNAGSVVEVSDAPNLNFAPTSPMSFDLWVFRNSASRARAIHRGVVRISDNDLVAQGLQVLRHPFALGGRLEQNARAADPQASP